MPTDWAELREYIATTGPTLRPLPEAVSTARGILGNLGMPGALRLTEPLVQAATIDSLPKYARDAYGLGWDPVRSLSYRSSARWGKQWGWLVPDGVRFTPEWNGVFPDMPAALSHVA